MERTGWSLTSQTCVVSDHPVCACPNQFVPIAYSRKPSVPHAWQHAPTHQWEWSILTQTVDQNCKGSR